MSEKNANDGVVESIQTSGRYERIELKLNYYGLAQALSKAGLIAEGFSVEYAAFEETILEVSLRREIREEP